MPDAVSHCGIVVGVDGSAASKAAMRWAADEAIMRGLPLSVVHTYAFSAASSPAMVWPSGGVINQFYEAEEAEARAVVKDAVSVLRADNNIGDRVEIISDILYGSPVSALVGVSKDAQMLVVGRHGRTQRLRSLMGSVTSGVIHHAHCPVAVVDDKGDAPHAEEPVLVGIDGSQASEEATQVAFDEAAWRGVGLVALHVWSDEDMVAITGFECSAVQNAAALTLSERLAGWQERYPEVAVDRVVRFQDPTKQLLEAATHAQLVVVGSRGRGGFAGMLLGSVSTAVALEATVPVIVVRGD
jgi:nucleotide-binding universal stress UspA family protein